MPRPSDHRITIRLKPEEYARVVARAGDKPLAPFIREIVLSGVAAKRKPTARRVRMDDQTAAQILAMLGQDDRVQAFQRAARDGEETLDAELAKDIRAGRVFLKDIRDLLMQALGRSA